MEDIQQSAIEDAKSITVSIASNPLDLRSTVETIMERVNRARRALKADAPLVVLIGEDHGLPVDLILQSMLLDRLRSECKVAYGFELPYNFLGTKLSQKLGYELSPEKISGVSRADSDGRHSLMAFLGYTDHFWAPVTRQSLLNRCLEKGVSTRFNDAANLGGQKLFIDRCDPQVRDIMARLSPEENRSNIEGFAPLGLKIRNIAIVENALRHIQETKPDVYLQHCGRNHLFGNTDLQAPYEDSLAALFERAGTPVQTVFIQISPRDIATIPSAPKDSLESCLYVTGLNRDRFTLARLSEDSFINRVCAESKAEMDIFKADSFFGNLNSTGRSRMLKTLKKNAPGLINALS